MDPFTRIINVLGIEPSRVSHAERVISAVGAFVGIMLVYLTNRFFLTSHGASILLLSLGASAVLLFAVPQGTLSQPWALCGGQLVSSVIGVSCGKLVPDVMYAAPLAVGISVAAMYYLRCLHPPGGATALAAVAGGPDIYSLGYGFVLNPVLTSTFTILAVAIAFNALFPWRRYPAFLNRRRAAPAGGMSDAEREEEFVGRKDFIAALKAKDSFMDIGEEDLIAIFEIARENHVVVHIDPAQLRPGSYYSNGEYGSHWSIREIIDRAENIEPDRQSIIYKVVAGAETQTTGVATQRDFLRWANHEVVKVADRWQRVDPTGQSEGTTVPGTGS